MYMRQALDIDSEDYSLVCNFAAALLSTGHAEEAVKNLQEIDVTFITKRSLVFSVHFNLACGHSLLGDTDKALEALVKAANLDPAATVTSLVDTQLDNIRNDERFVNLQKALEQYVLGKES